MKTLSKPKAFGLIIVAFFVIAAATTPLGDLAGVIGLFVWIFLMDFIWKKTKEHDAKEV